MDPYEHRTLLHILSFLILQPEKSQTGNHRPKLHQFQNHSGADGFEKSTNGRRIQKPTQSSHLLTLLSRLDLVTSSCRTLWFYSSCQRARRSAGPLPKLPQRSKAFRLESHISQCWVFSISCSHTPHCPPAFTTSRPKGLQKAV